MMVAVKFEEINDAVWSVFIVFIGGLILWIYRDPWAAHGDYPGWTWGANVFRFISSLFIGVGASDIGVRLGERLIRVRWQLALAVGVVLFGFGLRTEVYYVFDYDWWWVVDITSMFVFFAGIGIIVAAIWGLER